ncbi:hypothetical protein B0H13DRAFT_1881945 [Mycena leptocephala]|nr:hypothetical protein B0H13DRAFT_1881945 [Mycena leptocephala]
MYPQMRQQAGWDPAHVEHTGHTSVMFLRAISESEEKESFVLAAAARAGLQHLSPISLIPSWKLALDYWSRCNLATCADFMYPGSGGFSPAVRNLSSGALDYWIERNLASCIEFMYPDSAGLIATLAEPNASSAALDYCKRHFGDKDEEFARGLFMA